jgi:hypothetical protein
VDFWFVIAGALSFTRVLALPVSLVVWPLCRRRWGSVFAAPEASRYFNTETE